MKTQISKLLSGAMSERNISERKLAKECGISRGIIRKILKKENYNISSVEKILNFLEIKFSITIIER